VARGEELMGVNACEVPGRWGSGQSLGCIVSIVEEIFYERSDQGQQEGEQTTLVKAESDMDA
jgi:hypothetical protein